jgi:hypothetical protein
MMGRIFAAIEDEGGSFKDEALFRLERINQDADNLAYSAETRWNTHYLYAKVLLEQKIARRPPGSSCWPSRTRNPSTQINRSNQNN